MSSGVKTAYGLPLTARRRRIGRRYDPDDIYALCKSLQDQGIVINRPPRDGRMAFVKVKGGIIKAERLICT